MIPAAMSSAVGLLRSVDPERAHAVALQALRLGLAGRDDRPDDPGLSIAALGLRFRNPIGLAAGFDKNAEAACQLMRLGFGFVETGTVTRRPQPGNPRPRVFRLKQDRAIVNRLGFNNDGLDAYLSRLSRAQRRTAILGANIGLNRDGADPERDYAVLAAAVAPFADYIVVNVSSPNTPGLRALQAPERLRSILHAIFRASGARKPLLVKIAPDLADTELEDIVETCAEQGVAGMIVSNTTVSRPEGLASLQAREPGGLSGAPLFPASTAMLAKAWLAARGRLTLIGCGGVSTGAQAFEKILAGASLVQIYSVFAYEGPAAVPRLKAEMLEAARAAGFSAVADAVGRNAAALARPGLERA